MQKHPSQMSEDERIGKSYIAICLQAESYMNTLLKLILRRVIWRSI